MAGVVHCLWLAAILMGPLGLCALPYHSGSAGAIVSSIEVDNPRCLPTEDIPIQSLNLTDEQKSLLPSICWKPEQELFQDPKSFKSTSGRGVPPGVTCEATQW